MAMGLLAFNYVRDRRYLKKKTSEAMSRELWSDIEEEREQSLGRKERFGKALDEAKKG